MNVLRSICALALVLAFAIAPAYATDIGSSDWSETDASNTQTPPAGWPAGMRPNQVHPTGRAMMGAMKRWYDHANATLTSGGSANTQTLTYSVAPTAYVTGDSYAFIAGFTNTGATTLNVNSLGAKNIKIGSTALSANAIVAGQAVLVYYDGTQFQLLSPSMAVSPVLPSPTMSNPTISGTVTTSAAAWTLSANTAWTRALGAASAGTVQAFTYDVTLSGHAGGTTDIRGISPTVTASGTANIANIATSITSAEVFTTGGTTTAAYAHQDHVRLGLASTWTGGALTTASVYNGHIANEGNSALTNAWVFSAGSIDLVDGSGSVANSYGFYAADMGHATRVTNRAVSFAASDMTAGATITAAYYSEMASGTGKWGAYFSGDANNALVGWVRIGSTTAPSAPLSITRGAAGTVAATSLENNAITAANQGIALYFSLSRSGAPTVGSGGGVYALSEDDYSTGAKSKASLLFDTYSNGVNTALRLNADRSAVLYGGLTAASLATSGTANGSLCITAAGVVFVKTTAGACL